MDENLHQFTIDLLIDYKFSILTINDILTWGALDEDIYKYAEENNVAIITHDRRFGQFHYEASKKPPTTIVLEVVTPHPNQTNDLLRSALDHLNLILEKKHHNKLIIINRSKIRIRS